MVPLSLFALFDLAALFCTYPLGAAYLFIRHIVLPAAQGALIGWVLCEVIEFVMKRLAS